MTEEWIQELVLYITTKGSCKKEKYRSECVINVFTKLAGSRPSNNESKYNSSQYQFCKVQSIQTHLLAGKRMDDF